MDINTKQTTQHPNTNGETNPLFFSPSSIVAIFNAGTVVKEEKKIIQVRGVFKKIGTVQYAGQYYNRLKDEASDNMISLITPAVIHNQLDDNKTISFNGFITRRVDNKQGRIDININLIELLDQKSNKYSEEETKKIDLLNQKVNLGFKDLDGHIKAAIVQDRPLTIDIIIGKNAIIDSDIKEALQSASGLFDIKYHRINLTSPQDIIRKIVELDNIDDTVICVARGGGENLDIFENLSIAECILNRDGIIVSAIGHAHNVTLFEKLADKKFITPTQFGHYLKEIYNVTVEDFENSKAKLIQDITTQLKANYSKEVQNLNDQIKATKTLYETAANENKKTFNQQLESLRDQQRQKDLLVTQANSLAANYERQMKEAQRKSNLNIIAIIVAIVIGLVIGYFIAKK